MRAVVPQAGAEQVYSAVARLAQLLDVHVRRVADTLGITPGQVVALRELSEPMTLKDLASRMACERPNATYVADRMEEQHLVERRAHPSDRRSKLVVLTEAGHRCRLNVLEALASDSPLGALGQPDLDELIAVLARSVDRAVDLEPRAV